ncbi:MAG: hypothetical protein KF760_20865 [Candidatus Eremiobacteraeota bacterium]|nr:hypothetical protein [Candidatus Eremiobacteraeota bacterium]MCW5872902.1 hypothetical protein [Candidatus Eremiobacteraeota bacterium]
MQLKSGLALAALAIFLSTEGDILLALALRQSAHYSTLCLAVALLAGHFLVWLQVIKRLELSLAVPLTASSYLLNALLAPSQLSETLSLKALAGYILVTVGVVLVVAGEERVDRCDS